MTTTHLWLASMDEEDLFYHALAVLHDPGYQEANAGTLRMEWPRIPLPGWPELSSATPLRSQHIGTRPPQTNPSFRQKARPV